MNLDRCVIDEIKVLIDEIKAEKEIINPIIRDDVFSILQLCKCTVLYYPLEGEEQDGCDGCSLQKPVCGEMQQFVFINTNNTRERQAFSAAHELGHVWNADRIIQDKFPEMDLDSETIINRFAAELLMPERIFNEQIDSYLRSIDYKGPKIQDLELVKMVAYLMNEFFVPYKSVVIRLTEVNRLSEEFTDNMLQYKDSQYLKEIIKAEQYNRLGIVTKEQKSIDNLQEYLYEAQKREMINPTMLQNIKDQFDIQDINEISKEDIEF